VAAQLPGYAVHSVAQVGAGLDNVAFDVNGELIVRFSQEADPTRRATAVSRDAALLTAVAEISPVPTPTPRFVVAQWGCLAYQAFPGVPLLTTPQAQRSRTAAAVAAVLGDLLSALHAVPAQRMAGLVEPDHPPLAEWLEEASTLYRTVASHVPPAHRRQVESFVAAAPPAETYQPVFSHNDLGIEHVLVDPVTGAVTGVIDWSDAAIVDPAYDFGLLHRDIGPVGLDAALGAYRTGTNDVAALRHRAVFYARCRVFEDLAFGLDTGRDAYVTKSVAAMEWLFATGEAGASTRRPGGTSDAGAE
jgi:aminoglycoside phosphotransferase (APT) family kinase protein